MKKFTLIAAVVFTTMTLQSCRQSDDVLSPLEAATLKKVQDSSSSSLHNVNSNSLENNQGTVTSSLEGEIAPPPRR